MHITRPLPLAFLRLGASGLRAASVSEQFAPIRSRLLQIAQIQSQLRAQRRANIERGQVVGR
jgi:hypothetical protein